MATCTKDVSQEIQEYVKSDELKDNMETQINGSLEWMENASKALKDAVPKSKSSGKGYFYRTKWSP